VVTDDDGFTVQGDGGADVAGDSVQGLADFEAFRVSHVEDEMFFTLHEDLHVSLQLFKADAWVGVFCGYGFVAEVQGDVIR
jgi:hypothetical protein